VKPFSVVDASISTLPSMEDGLSVNTSVDPNGPNEVWRLCMKSLRCNMGGDNEGFQPPPNEPNALSPLRSR